ncbi:MAG: hypothetical protein Q7S29_05290 [Candidatus Peribacter sp.]|nr:hypothetical protein [Candidatus Peribacter sp.]
MTESSPPSEDVQNAQLFKRGLLEAFEHLFVQTQCQREIAEVVKSLEQRRPIVSLMQPDKGSFSTIFLPFHAGGVRFRAIAKSCPLHPNLLEFCALAGKIESLSDTMGITGEEPSEADKEELLPLLEEFLAVLPSSKEFASWLT